MIFLEIFWTFLKIGIFTFGGGYAMVALIQNEVVVKHAWLTAQEFTDVLAVSQMTPGPLGINTATYAGYTAVLNAGHSAPLAVGGAIVASVAVVLLPVLLVLVVYRYLLRYQKDARVQRVLRMVRLAVVGLLAAAALGLMNRATFGENLWASITIFAGVFLLSLRGKKPGPIVLILLSGLAGLLFL